VKEFEDKAANTAGNAGTSGKSIKAFAEYLKMVEESGIPITDKDDIASELDAVQILTAHGAKGLEFDTVFVVNLVDGRFPVRKKADPLKVPDELTKEVLGEGDFRIEEERRLFYVAMTRAKRRLYLTYSPRYEGAKEWKRSQFLDEVSESGLIEDKNLDREIEENVAGIGVSGSAESENSKAKNPHPPVIRRIPTAWENYRSFSYSQVDTFRTCPLKYACRYVINLSEPVSQVMTFGTTLHNTLDEFYKNLDVTNPETYSLETLHKITNRNGIRAVSKAANMRKRAFSKASISSPSSTRKIHSRGSNRCTWKKISISRSATSLFLGASTASIGSRTALLK